MPEYEVNIGMCDAWFKKASFSLYGSGDANKNPSVVFQHANVPNCNGLSQRCGTFAIRSIRGKQYDQFGDLSIFTAPCPHGHVSGWGGGGSCWNIFTCFVMYQRSFPSCFVCMSDRLSFRAARWLAEFFVLLLAGWGTISDGF